MNTARTNGQLNYTHNQSQFRTETYCSFTKMLHSFLTKAAVSPIYSKSHATSLLCVVERWGSEHLLSPATPECYLSSSHLCLQSSCCRPPHAQETLWWTMPLQPLSKWHSNLKNMTWLHALRHPKLTALSWASPCQNSTTFPSDFSWEALSDLCLALPLRHSAAII